MKIVSHIENLRASWKTLPAIAFLIVGLSLHAVGSLGGSMDSVEDDQARIKAKPSLTQTPAFEVHEMKTPTGTVIREYVSTSGRVFGVTWQGLFIPDMRHLLGSYFEQYSRAARAQRETHVGRWPLDIRDPGLVVQSAGHMRFYYGRAYDPTLLPPEVRVNDIR
jgi:hypothetical protein